MGEVRKSIPASDVAKELKAEILVGSSYQDCSCVFLTPTRGMIDSEVVDSWQYIMSIPNQERYWVFVKGEEVGLAYERGIESIFSTPTTAKCKYLLTLEDDNIPPPNCLSLLMQTIVKYSLDAVGGLYWVKGEAGFPLVMGNARLYAEKGILNYAIQDPVELAQLGNIWEVNAVPMGCTLFRLDLFKELKKPWFQTTAMLDIPNGIRWQMTHDVFFCHNAKLQGKRFAIDSRVKVAHLDTKTGVKW
ncbi:hypothetical protein [Glutamicibacter sp.]|jgi:hypothetical protein|uniref:hypothetical protein n=1 Tax=Glutamicibacter sp. TaxID=1931995 RepID=UPI002FDA842D